MLKISEMASGVNRREKMLSTVKWSDVCEILMWLQLLKFRRVEGEREFGGGVDVCVCVCVFVSVCVVVVVVVDILFVFEGVGFQPRLNPIHRTPSTSLHV